jgi:hypothetical protein
VLLLAASDVWLVGPFHEASERAGYEAAKC